MAIFKWNNRIYMSEAEIKAMSDELKKDVKPVTMMDLQKAERIVVNKADLKVQEIQAEQEKLS